MRYRLPRPAIRAGVVYVTEDRKREGFFKHMSIADNVYTNYLGAGLQAHGVVSLKETKVLAEHWTKALQVKALDLSASVIELSGGNQQKVVIAAALVKRPQLIIFDEPTRGVDVGAIADIHQLIRQLAGSGMGVVVISSYLPEISICRTGFSSPETAASWRSSPPRRRMRKTSCSPQSTEALPRADNENQSPHNKNQIQRNEIQAQDNKNQAEHNEIQIDIPTSSPYYSTA